MTDCATVNATVVWCPFCKSQGHTLTFRETLTRTIHHLLSYQHFALAWSIRGNLRACLVSLLAGQPLAGPNCSNRQKFSFSASSIPISKTQPPSHSPPQSPRTQSFMPHTFRPFRGKPTTLAEDQAQEMDSKSDQTNPSQSGEGATNMPTISNAGPPPLSITFPPREQQTLAPLTGNSRLRPTIPTARKSMRTAMMTLSRRSSSYSSSPSSRNFPSITKRAKDAS